MVIQILSSLIIVWEVSMLDFISVARIMGIVKKIWLLKHLIVLDNHIIRYSIVNMPVYVETIVDIHINVQSFVNIDSFYFLLGDYSGWCNNNYD